MRIGVLLLAAGASLPLAARAESPAPRQGLPPGPARTKEFQARVNRAIDRGVEWLRPRQQEDGGFLRDGLHGWGLGPTALAVLTLRACGAPAGDPQVLRGLENLRRGYPTDGGIFHGNETYGISLTLLALEMHYDPIADGTRAIPEADRAWIRRLVAEVVGAQAPGGGFGYSSRSGPGGAVSAALHGPGYWDNSNSQFAILGLGAARLLCEGPPPEVWKKSLRHWMATQAEDGPWVPVYRDAGVGESGYGGTSLREAGRGRARGWFYRDDHKTYDGSMTAGGVSSVALCRDALAGDPSFGPRLAAASLASMRDGIAWLGRNFSVRYNPLASGSAVGINTGFPLFHYYYLYGLERAGVLAGTSWMARHDWYLEGAEFLLERQRPDGSWKEDMGRRAGPEWGAIEDLRMPQVDTCMALLFLKRATARLRTSTPRPSGVAPDSPPVATEEGIDPALGPGLEEGPFRDLFAAVFARFKKGDAAARAERAADFVLLGTRSIPLLLLRLDDGDLETRRASFEALRLTTGLAHGFDPAASAGARAAAAAAWEEWWFARRGALVADAGAGVFR